MVAITLPNRRTLAKRIPNFGREGRTFRFGDSAAEKAKVEDVLALITSGASYAAVTNASRTIDWKSVYAMDPAYAENAYVSINRKTIDPDFARTVHEYVYNTEGAILKPEAPAVISPEPVFVSPTLPVNTPITINTVAPDPVTLLVDTSATSSNPVSVTPALPSTPSNSDTDYADSVVKAQIEAARLEAMATANQARARYEAEQAKWVEEKAILEKEKAELKTKLEQDESEESATSEKQKTTVMPWLIAAGVAFLVLKG